LTARTARGGRRRRGANRACRLDDRPGRLSTVLAQESLAVLDESLVVLDEPAAGKSPIEIFEAGEEVRIVREPALVVRVTHVHTFITAFRVLGRVGAA